MIYECSVINKQYEQARLRCKKCSASANTFTEWRSVCWCLFNLPCDIMCQHLYPSFLWNWSDSIPGRQSVTEEFALGWPEVLSSLHGVALAWIDSRSRVSQGQKSSTLDPRKLGSLRIKDKLGVVEWVILSFQLLRIISIIEKSFCTQNIWLGNALCSEADAWII